MHGKDLSEDPPLCHFTALPANESLSNVMILKVGGFYKLEDKLDHSYKFTSALQFAAEVITKGTKTNLTVFICGRILVLSRSQE